LKGSIKEVTSSPLQPLPLIY